MGLFSHFSNISKKLISSATARVSTVLTDGETFSFSILLIVDMLIPDRFESSCVE